MSKFIESMWENTSTQPLKGHLQGPCLRLKHWPNFGFAKYRSEYLTLSAIMIHQPMTAKELIQVSQSEPHIVHSFLNTACLMDLIEVTESKHSEVYWFNHKVESFTSKLKQALGLGVA